MKMMLLLAMGAVEEMYESFRTLTSGWTVGCR